MERAWCDLPVLQLHSGICFKAAQLNKPKLQPKKTQIQAKQNASREENGRRVWSVLDTAAARSRGMLEHFVGSGLSEAAAAAALVPCPELGMCCAHSAGSGAGHTGGSCWQQEELEGREARTKSSPCPGTPQLLSCSARRAQSCSERPGLQEWWESSHSSMWSPAVAAGGFHRKEQARGSESMFCFSGPGTQTSHEGQSTGCVLLGHLKSCHNEQF